MVYGITYLPIYSYMVGIHRYYGYWICAAYHTTMLLPYILGILWVGKKDKTDSPYPQGSGYWVVGVVGVVGVVPIYLGPYIPRLYTPIPIYLGYIPIPPIPIYPLPLYGKVHPPPIPISRF